MGRFLLVVLLAGCTHHAATTTGPAWPKQAAAETDGGESLSPHVARREVTAIERSVDDKPTAMPMAAPAAASSAPGVDAGPAPMMTAPTPPIEETITTEDIVIEIDD